MRPKRAGRGVRRYLPGGWSEKTKPVHAFLVEHTSGLYLFDAGQTARATRGGYLPRWHPFLRLARFELRPEDEVAAQLRRQGIDAADLTAVVLSHLHTDHVGGLSGLPVSDVLVTRTEWERAVGIGGRLRGYVPQHWPANVRPRLVDFDGPAIGPFPASFDVAGDGRLLLVPTPGHTPGHTALYGAGDGVRFLCVGDLVHTAAELTRAAPTVAAFCRAHGVVVLACHDPEAPESVP